MVSYTYDNLSRLDSRILNTLNPFVTSYEYLPGGQNESTTLLVGSMRNGDTRLSYTYDAVGNIETISENGELKAKYYYDELSQLVREDNRELNQTIVYEYDQGGNIQSKTRYVYTEGELGEAVGTDTYSYQAEDLWADVLTGYNGQKFTYDEIGNPLTYRDGMSFSWQYGRQLETAITEEEVIGYWYNADGIRTKKIRSNGEVTDYYLNGSNIITMITNSVMDPENPKRLDFYYDQNSMLIGFRYNGHDYWYIRNGQNDIAGILDSTGTQIVSYTYDSWGVPISTTGSMAETIGEINPFRYRGYYYDSETGLYYLNSRYYDPVVGRFLSADDESLILASPDGLTDKNLFSYCDNNPIIRSDSGGKAWFISAIVGGVLGGGLEMANQLISGKSFSELDWCAIGIETLSGVASGLLFSFGAIGKLSKHAVNTGKVIINGVTSVLHSAAHHEDLGTATIKAAGTMVVTKVKGSFSESRYQPRHARPRPVSEAVTSRLGRAAIRTAPNVSDIASGVMSTSKQTNSVNSSSSSYYYTSGMSSFLTYSQAINYGLI